VSKRLAEAITWAGRRRQAGEREQAKKLSAAAFRATVGERLSSLERQLDEVKGRINGLLFLVAGTVLAQVIIRLLG
jgi:hypothetical protein